jgi:6,7-dimethyl-8-ribityllumazine synthase
MATAEQPFSSVDLAGVPSAKGMRFALVVSEWNADITGALYQGAHETLLQLGASAGDVIRYDVPGAFELIYASRTLLTQSDFFDAVVAIGSIIEGETAHFDYVCQGVTAGIAQLNTLGKAPVIFCVLTDRNRQQSLDRAGGKYGNKGVEAAVAAIKMAHF